MMTNRGDNPVNRSGQFTIAGLAAVAVIGLIMMSFWPLLTEALGHAFDGANLLTKALLSAIPALLVFVFIATPIALQDEDKRSRRTRRRRR